MKASLSDGTTTVEFYFLQDRIFPFPLYDTDTEKFEGARTDDCSTPPTQTHIYNGKKPGTGYLNITATQLSYSEVDTILDWINDAEELTFTLPTELFGNSGSRSYTVKIPNHQRGSHLGGGTGYYDLPMKLNIIE